MRRDRKRRTQKKKGLSLNALLWLTVIVIILIYSILNTKSILGTVSKLSQERDTTEDTEENDVEHKKRNESQDKERERHEKAPEKMQQEIPKGVEEKERTQNSREEAPTDVEQENSARNKTVSSQVYFVNIRNDGSFSLVKRARAIEKTKAVLTKTLNALLLGTTARETQEGLTSLIPQSSVVKSVSVKNRIAYVNMNEEFQFNPLGHAALEAQIYQLIYTSTEFSTIDKVQILIEGKQVSYLSSEGGLLLAHPLSRDDLSSSFYTQ